jgi:hypothetical protein
MQTSWIFLRHFPWVPTWSFAGRVGGARKGKQNQSTLASPDFRFDGAFVHGREDASCTSSQQCEINKNARARIGKMEAADFAFRSNQFSFTREEETLSAHNQDITHERILETPCSHEWMNIADVRTHKKLSATTNNSKIVAAAKHEDIISSKELGGGILVILLHRALRFAHRWCTFFMPLLKGHPRTSI